MYAGRRSAPGVCRAAATVAAYATADPAFRRSDHGLRAGSDGYALRNFDELFDYCRYSANPVGRLVLGLCGYRDAARQELSDATCTALQLANFWQDVTVDLEKDRVYLPLDLLEKHGYPGRGAVRASLRRALPGGHAGSGRRRAGAVPQGPAAGRASGPAPGHRSRTLQPRRHCKILEKIERQDYDVLRARPADLKMERVGLLLGALARRAFSRAA